MKTRYLILILCVFVILTGCTGLRSTPGALQFRVGAASAPVTPPVGTFLAGYDSNRRSTGVHDDLYAKAVVFDDGTSPVAVVVVDCVGLQYPTVNAMRALAASKTTEVTLPAERIIITSTHTHCGPDVIGLWGPDSAQSGYDTAYMDQLVQTTADQVARAAANLQPARIVCAETQCSGWAVNDSEPGEVDHTVSVLQCLDQNGKSIATLTNFACHPTVLDGDTTVASSDWVGAFYGAMAAALPGEHLFLQGAIGGWIQPVTPERTFALAEKYGKDLADKTLTALKSATAVKEPNVKFANRPFVMPVANEAFKQMSALKLIPRPMRDGAETEVAWFSIGPAQFATHPGESAPVFSNQTKALMDTGPKFVLGLGFDELGYIIKPAFFQNSTIPHSEYLTSMSPGPDAGPKMMEALEAIVP
ncbi:MAG: neutral/alkaline non-lysosomal ceramidase N-terminal domain-containing protein [Candidatus Hydrogenedentes bacterium]|nr:neutral/alkaline non-lysosomal ceramidase N-terminal domain-containing protein [Candidatus Hydrogenedentota bacterium]